MNNTDEDNNGSGNENYDAPEAIAIINCVLNVPLMLMAILGNALVLVAIKRTPSVRSTSMDMLCSLAITDLLVGFCVQPLYIAHQLTRESHLHLLEGSIGHSVCGVSFLTITAITVDRFLALTYHMRYASLVTKSRARWTLTTLWLISLRFTRFVFLEYACLSFSNGRYNCHLSVNLHVLLHKNLSNCSATSITDTGSTSGQCKVSTPETTQTLYA